MSLEQKNAILVDLVKSLKADLGGIAETIDGLRGEKEGDENAAFDAVLNQIKASRQAVDDALGENDKPADEPADEPEQGITREAGDTGHAVAPLGTSDFSGEKGPSVGAGEVGGTTDAQHDEDADRE